MDFNFNDKEINFDDIENDSELLDELASLGWNHDHDIKPNVTIKPQKPQSAKPSNVSAISIKPTTLSNQQSSSQVEINKLMNNNDDDTVDFTEEDESDPELLLAFANIQNSVDDEASADVITKTFSSIEVVATKSDIHSPETTIHTLTIPKPIDQQVAAAPSLRQLSRNDSKKSITMDNCSIADARKMAAKCKREGNIDEALKWMKRSKVLEKGDEIKTVISSTPASTTTTAGSNSRVPKVSQNTASIPSATTITARVSKQTQPSQTQTQKLNSANPQSKVILSSQFISDSSSSSSSRNSVGNGIGDMFSPLEKALTEAANVNLEEAKRLKAINNNTEAIIKLREYKKYSQELDVLRGRRQIPGATPAIFKWQTVRKEKKIENTDIGEDQLKFLIMKVSGLNASLQTYSSRSICINYDLGFPKDEPIVGKLNGTVNKDGIMELNFNTCISSIIKRTTKNLTASMIARKKMQFELFLKRGFLFSDIPLGTASLPLTDLLTKCECGGILPLMMEDAKGRKQVVAGTIEAYIKLRSPITGPEVVATEERILLLDPWPEINIHISSNNNNNSNNNSSKSSASIAVPSTLSSVAIVSSSSTSSTATTTTAIASVITTAHTDNPFSDLSDTEKTDPCNVTFLLSNDVLEDEQKRITENLVLLKNKSKDELFHLNLRLQIVNTKLDILVRSVQDGQISMEDYLSMLKERIKRDLKILQYLKSSYFQPMITEDGDETTSSALYLSKQVTHRILIMQKEVKGAEESA